VDSLKGSLGAGAALQELRSRIDLERWERIFERCLRDCEGKEGKKAVSGGGSLQRQAQLAAASGTSSTSSPLLYYATDEQHRQMTRQSLQRRLPKMYKHSKAECVGKVVVPPPPLPHHPRNQIQQPQNSCENGEIHNRA
jgi:hypothetical protein